LHHQFKFSILTFSVIVVLLLSVFPVGNVMAQDETPPPVETPAAEETTTTVDNPIAIETIPANEFTVQDVGAQTPEELVVMLVSPTGEAPTLTEEALGAALTSSGSIYCPENAFWGDSACTGPLPTIDEAITEAFKQGSGRIYVAIDYTDARLTPVMIDGLNLPGGPGLLGLLGGVDFSTGNMVGITTLNRPIIVSNLEWGFYMENFIISGVEGTAITTRNVGVAAIVDTDLIGNEGAGMDIIANNYIDLEDVTADNNAQGISVVGGFVTLYRVSTSGTISGNGMNIQAKKNSSIYPNDSGPNKGNLYIESSKFNDNDGSGLNANAEGSIVVACSQASRNGLAGLGSGMILSSGTDITILCSKLKDNSNYGLQATAINNIYLDRTTISGNARDTLLVSPNPVQYYSNPVPYYSNPEKYYSEAPCSYLCPSCNDGGSGGEEEKPVEGNNQVVIVKVDEGSGTTEIKAGYSTVFKLYEQQEDAERLVQLTALTSGSAPDGSSAVYTPLDENQLPAPPPEGASLIPWGFNIAITNPDGSAVESLNGYMLVRFYLPEGFVLPGGMRLVIQYFDPATSSWTPMSTAVGGGMAYTFASKPGTYVLTMEPIQ
jgi:hypothetical protein